MTSIKTSTDSWLLGVNLSGAEYGDPTTGVMYYNYIYPTNDELDHFASDGANVIRLPLSLERLQPTPDGALDPTQLSYIDGIVAHAAADDLKVILDPHNFGYAYGAEIGNTAASDEEFANFWSKMAAHFASDNNVIFGLMNEPHAQTASEWLVPTNMAISAIRASGATQEILVSGTWFDTADTWVESGNAAVLGNGVVDPLSNYAFEVHQYLDSDSSGTHDAVVSATIGVERLTEVSQWAESTGNKLFLGEFGVGSDPLSLAAMSNMLTYMQQHTDVWQGGTYWAAGPWMGNYMYSAATSSDTDTPQMTTLEHFMNPPEPTSDTTLPTITVAESASGLQNTTSVTISGSTSDSYTGVARVEVYDVSDGQTSDLGSAVLAGNGSWTFLATQLTNGVHQFSAVAMADDGNATGQISAGAAITVDTVAPQPMIQVITGDRDGGVTLAGVSKANSTVTISDTINGQTTSLGNVTTSSAGDWTLVSHALVNLTSTNSFSATAVDPAGNTGAMHGGLYLASTRTDTLSGTPGVSDVFAIMSFKGSDVIKNFQPASTAGAVHDYIDFSGRGITSFAQVGSMISGTSSAIITFAAGKTITLTGVAPSLLTSNDFRFS